MSKRGGAIEECFFKKKKKERNPRGLFSGFCKGLWAEC